MSNLTKQTKRTETYKRIAMVVLFLGALLIFTTVAFEITAYAAKDPLEAVKSLQTYFAKFIEAIGIIAVLVGVLILGTSLMSHDAQQRITGIIVIAAGALIAGATFVVEVFVGTIMPVTFIPFISG